MLPLMGATKPRAIGDQGEMQACQSWRFVQSVNEQERHQKEHRIEESIGEADSRQAPGERGRAKEMKIDQGIALLPLPPHEKGEEDGGHKQRAKHCG